MDNIVKYNSQLLKSVLLLVLAVSGNFVGNTLGCQTQYNLTNNMYAKHLLLLFIIYFTLNFSIDDKQNPFELLKNALIIWVCFLLFTKQNITFTVLTALLFVFSYLIDNFIDYNEKMIKESKSKNDKVKLIQENNNLTKYRNCAFTGAVTSLVIGFLLYAKEKKDEYKNNFDLGTFIFGKVTCDSLK